MVSDGFWTIPPIYFMSVVTLMTSRSFFHITLVTAGLAPCDRHVMVTDWPSTTGAGVPTDTIGLSTKHTAGGNSDCLEVPRTVFH